MRWRPPSPTTTVTLIGTAIVLALVLPARLWRGTWYDESFTVVHGRSAWSDFWAVTWDAELNQLPYYLLQRAWSQVSLEEAWLRVPSLVALVATVPVVMALGRRLSGSATMGAAAAILLTVHAAAVEYAAEARGYTLAMLLVASAALLLLRGIDLDRPADWIGFVAVSVVAAYVHFFAVLAIVGIAVGTLWSAADLPWRHWLGALVAVAAGWVPLGLFALQARTSQIAWIADGLSQEPWRTMGFLAGRPGGLPAALVAGGLLATGTHAGLRCILRDGKGRSSLALPLLLSWGLAPPLLGWLLSQYQPVLVPRYTLVAVPAVALLLGLAVDVPRHRVAKAAVFVVAALALLVPTLKGVTAHRPEDWAATAAALATHASPDDGVVVVPAHERVPLEHELRQQGLMGDAPTPVSPDEAWGSIPGGPEPLDATTRPGQLWLVAVGEGSLDSAPFQGLDGVEQEVIGRFGSVTLFRLYRARS